ncbi:Protein cps3 [Cyberlindnera fabianii]|uniref:Protein cps3 n=1 Tax=Cyberlindnera fabianii TaxID=36022 RepID=A0A1V2L4J5_CYBFA|nr:Protein cps3 [Cyberlindnera fabianii]
MANRTRSSFSKSQRSSGDVSKSPPSKNLAHVPCKFFKQGACQAGNACPFSHQLDTNSETAPCKYFQKGNCKFGAKCALAHILPDGRRVNPKTLAQVYQNHNVATGSVIHNTNANTNGNGHSQAHEPLAQTNGTNGKTDSTTLHSSTMPMRILNNSGVGSAQNGFFTTRTLSFAESPTVPILSPPSSFNATLVTNSDTPPSGFTTSRVTSTSHAGSLPLPIAGSGSSMSRPSVSFAQLKENVVWEGPPVGAEEGEEDDDEEEDTQFKMDEDQEFLGRTSVAVDIGSLKIS